MRRCIFILFLIIFQASFSRAVVSNAIPLKTIQGDGEHITLFLHGDEHFHTWMTSDGYPVGQDERGAWVYLIEEKGAVRTSGILAHEPEKRTSEETAFIEQHAKALSDVMHQLWEQSAWVDDMSRQKKMRKVSGEPTRYTGCKKGLVLLVEFADNTFSQNGTRQAFDDMFNKPGYSENGNIGSVHDYFADQSYGQFLLSFDVLGPYKLSRKMSYYGGNDVSDTDRHPGEMVIEACKQADGAVNYQDYDWDDDGEVEQVFIIYAGYGESAGAPPNTIWPHESRLSRRKQKDDGGGAVELDGVLIDTYACSFELAGSRGAVLNGIGTVCHEFCHCLGFPDFYDISYSGGFGMGPWDLMSSGSHAGPEARGEVPYGLSAYERWLAGWLTFKDVTNSTQIASMPNLGDEPVAYRFVNDHTPSEYITMENHQNEKWFSYVGKIPDCHGLMVTHIDYDESCWQANRVNNNARHQRMCIIPADQSFGKLLDGRYYPADYDLSGDLYPGNHHVTELTRTSHRSVGGFYYQSGASGDAALNYALMNIQESEGSISLDLVQCAKIYAPASRVSDVSENAFTISWQAVDGADYYDVELTSVIAQKPFRSTTQIIEKITGTRYTLASLDLTNYRYRIRSSVDGITSEWSEYVHVSLLPDMIASVPEDKGAVRLYDLNGIRQDRPQRRRRLLVGQNGRKIMK